LGLGIELKLVALNKEIDKTGRIGAIIIGILLVTASLFLYLNPSITNRNQASSTTANTALVPAPTLSEPTTIAATVAPAEAAIVAPPAAPTALPAPTATLVPTAVPPTATAVPTAAPPTATPVPTAVPPTATAIPSVLVPDLHDQDEKGAQRKLKEAGLTPKKVDACTGTDQGEQNARKGRVQCQNPAANQPVAPGATVEYVLAGK
jgi:hypothetical protein